MKRPYIHPDCNLANVPPIHYRHYPKLVQIICYHTDPYPEHSPLCEMIEKGFIYFLN